MTSSLDKLHKGYRTESRNKHSWWWDSHISPRNSKWLAENIEEMDQNVKRMLKLLEDGGNSFAQKAEMYYQKRPDLVSHVEEFYRMYKSLAERYHNVTGELRKNIPSDLQSQGSGISDVSSEPPSRRRSGTRATGFDVFLKTGGSSSDLVTKEGDETSTLDSESESDDSSVNNYSSASANSDRRGLRKRITELETELRKFQIQQEENENIEEELRTANEKIRVSENVIRKLNMELQKYELGTPQPADLEDAKTPILNNGIESEFYIELKVTREKLLESEEEVKRLRHELENNGSSNNHLQEKLGSAQKEISTWKSKFEKEKREVLKVQDRITRYKANLSERDREIRAMRETLSNANKTLSEENQQLQDQATKLLKEQALLNDTIKEWDLRCQCSEEDLRRINIVKTQIEAELESVKWERNDVVVKLGFKEAQIERLTQQLDRLYVERVELVDEIGKSKKSIEELTCRSEELRREVERQREVIKEGAEEKREVIRQLCFSLEHYRDEYQWLRQAFVGHNKRHPVMAS